MRTPATIYDEYRIMSGLQLHQLRVAAVGKTICESLTIPIDKESVVTACLFHDMGNIIKSNLSLFPEFYGEQPLAYWEQVKKEYIEKYGTNEDHATIEIAEELRLSGQITRLMAGIGFTKLELVRDDPSYEQKIVEYSDLRVQPHGVSSLAERIEEGRIRYEGKGHFDFPDNKKRYGELVSAAHEVERQIFSVSTITPESITEDSVQAIVAELRELPIVV